MAIVYDDTNATTGAGKVVYDPPPDSNFTKWMKAIPVAAEGAVGNILGTVTRPTAALLAQVQMAIGLGPKSGQGEVSLPRWAGGSQTVNTPYSAKGLQQLAGNSLQTGVNLLTAGEGGALIQAAPIRTLAGLGGISAAGQSMSENQPLGETVKNTAKGMAFGGALGATGRVAANPAILREIPSTIRDVVIPEWQRNVNAKESVSLDRANDAAKAKQLDAFSESKGDLEKQLHQSEQREQTALDAQKLTRKELEQKIGKATSQGRESLAKLNEFKAATGKQIDQVSADMDSKIASVESDYEKAVGESAANSKAIVSKGYSELGKMYKNAISAAEQRIAASGDPLYMDDFVANTVQPLAEEIEQRNLLSRGKVYSLVKPLLEQAEESSAALSERQSKWIPGEPLPARRTISPKQLPSLSSEIRNTIREAVQQGNAPYNVQEHWANRFGDLYGDYLEKNVPELKKANQQYRVMRKAYDPILKRIKPWNEYETRDAEGLIRKLTTPGESVSFGERRALERVRRGYGDVAGMEQIGKEAAPAGKELANLKQIRQTVLQKMNSAIEDQAELTRIERTSLARQVDKWRIERQAVGDPEAATTKIISEERVAQPKLKEQMASLKQGNKSKLAELDEQLAAAQERISEYDNRLRRYAFARNAILGAAGLAGAAKVGLKTYEATQ